MDRNETHELEAIELGAASDLTHGQGMSLTDSPAGQQQAGILED